MWKAGTIASKAMLHHLKELLSGVQRGPNPEFPVPRAVKHPLLAGGRNLIRANGPPHVRSSLQVARVGFLSPGLLSPGTRQGPKLAIPPGTGCWPERVPESSRVKGLRGTAAAGGGEGEGGKMGERELVGGEGKGRG